MTTPIRKQRPHVNLTFRASVEENAILDAIAAGTGKTKAQLIVQAVTEFCSAHFHGGTK